MARSRNIKPGFYKNEELAGCSIMARFIFPGLWMLADRQGRLEDRPMRIKAELLPYEGGDVGALLDELQLAGMIVRYEVNGARYIQVLAFDKHQTPHHREPQSTIPAPVEPKESPRLYEHQDGTEALGNTQARLGPAPVEPKESPSAAPPDSLIPDSLIPDTRIKPSCAERRTADRFQEFWDAWPRTDRKVNRKGCLDKWRAKGLDAQADAILSDIAIQRRTAKWRDGFEPAPATYLSQERWGDGLQGDGKSESKPAWRDGSGQVIQIYQPTAEELAAADHDRMGFA